MSRGLRGRLLLTVILAVGVALAMIVLAFNLVLGARLDGDASDQLRSRASAALDSLQIVDGRIRAPEAPDAAAVDQPIWIFAGRQLIETPRVSGAKLIAGARNLAVGPGRYLDADPSTRLLSLPVLREGRRLGTVVSGVSLAPYQRSERLALLGSVAMALVILIAVALASRWLLAAGLRPVDRMAADAAAWSERDLERRFGLGPPRDEFTRLAWTLDRLLDRLSGAIKHEQRFSAELSHELRTPLTRMRARAQLALSAEADGEEGRLALTSTIAETDKLTRTIDAMMAASRNESGGTGSEAADAREVAEAVADACGSGEAGERPFAIEVRDGQELLVGIDPSLAERILSPVVENACRHAASRVEIAIAGEGSEVCFEVTDDGSGIAPGELNRIFEPGVRGATDSPTDGTDGAGLGLALARRLARAGGGEVEALPCGTGGRFSIRLPAAGLRHPSSAFHKRSLQGSVPCAPSWP